MIKSYDIIERNIMGKAAKLLGWIPDNKFNFAHFNFESARFFEKNKNLEHEIRKSNLIDISRSLTRCGIKHWLQGKTLLGFTAYKGFIPDHDDDIAIDAKDLEICCINVIQDLINQGFTLIRVNSDDSMISLERNRRYIDICVFSYKCNSTFYGYGKYYPSIYYSTTFSYNIYPDFSIAAPEGSLEICNLKYQELCNYRLNTFIIWEHGLSRIQDINQVLIEYDQNIIPIEIKKAEIKRSDLSDFLETLYCKEKHSAHIYEKCRLLLQAAKLIDDSLYSLAIVKYAYKEDGIHALNPKKIDAKSRTLFHEMKWKVREQFNPRFNDKMQHIKLPNTSPGISHCHVIHSADTIGEIVLIDQLVEKYSKKLGIHKRYRNFI